jgi:type I restriction enzyme S subunit
MSAVDERHGTIARPEIRPYGEVCRGYTYFEEGDVLFAKITPCMQNGKHAIARGLIDGIGFGSTEFHILRPGPLITSDWIHRFIRQPAVLREATAHFTGSVGQQRVPERFLASLAIPLPPLPDQRRIAAILGEQMAAVERARTAAEAQLEAAKALPAAYLRAVFDSPEAQTWPRRRLGEIAAVSGGIQKSPSRTPRSFHRPFLTVRNVQRGWLDLSEVERFEITPEELLRYRLQEGDLLIVEGNGSLQHIGRNAVFNDEVEDCVHQNHLIRVRVNGSHCSPEFVSCFLNSDIGKEQMVRKAGTTTGLHTLSVSKVEQLEVPVPPMSEQQHIMATLDRQLNVTDQACQALEEQIDVINRLPATLLLRAFAGEL